MPSVLGMRHFGGRTVAYDELIVVSGTAPIYSTTQLPPNSPSSTSIQGTSAVIRGPWWDHVTGSGTKFEPSTNEFWYHFRFRCVFTTLAATRRYGVSRDGTPIVSVSMETTTNKITLMVGSVVKATAVSAAVSISQWERFHVHVEGYDAGDVLSVYMAGNLTTPVVSHVLTGSDATAIAALGKPNEFYIVIGAGSGGQTNLDDFVAWDPEDPDFPGIEYFYQCGIAEQVFTADGAETDWSGGFADIDERPYSDADKITATSVGDQSSFTKPAIGEEKVYAVSVTARVTKTSSSAGDNLIISTINGGDQEDLQVEAPGDGFVSAVFNNAPDGDPWDPTGYDASRISFTTAA